MNVLLVGGSVLRKSMMYHRPRGGDPFRCDTVISKGSRTKTTSL